MPLSGEKDIHNTGSYRPLLDEGNDEVDLDPPSRSRRWPFSWHMIAHLALLATYTTVFFAGNHCLASLLLQSTKLTLVSNSGPAKDAIQYERVAFNGDLDKANRYKGPPRPELDQAWSELLANFNIRVSKDTLTKINRTSIQLADGSGDYYAGLNVHHHLHCLKFVRHYLHRGYYNNTAEFSNLLEEHIDHCLDDIRQVLMCHADTSIYTYDWQSDNPAPWPNFEVDHECVDWEALDGWASTVSFSVGEPGMIVHPTLGEAFPQALKAGAMGGSLHHPAMGDGRG